MKASIGVDYGTNSCRAIVADCANGAELGSAFYNYESGRQGVITDPANALLARQNPADYIKGLEACIRGALADAAKRTSGFTPADVCAVGVDTTGSSPMPVLKDNSALGMAAGFADNLNAQCWLWKDHTSLAEAEAITALAKQIRPQYLAKCGGSYSSEWFWSKILHCLNLDEKVFDAAYTWVEIADWIPSVLAGVKDADDVVRGVCAAGHKAMYAEEWGGLPDAEFLGALSPKLAGLLKRLYLQTQSADKKAGALCEEWAKRLGLKAGIAIAVGEIDVHYGAIAGGVSEGVLVKAIGTSACDCTVSPLTRTLPDIPGICGIVKSSILPGYYGLEAGQAAVGDIFKWWIETVLQGDGKMYETLRLEAAKFKPAQSGLIALDWNNGNRNTLADQRLTGLILGQTLSTARAEIYRALIESTAYGARTILERFEEYGVKIEKLVFCGGIAQKDPLAMQIYADICKREIFIAESAQTCALGAAIGGAVAAGVYKNFEDAQRGMVRLKPQSYKPTPADCAVYEELYALYKKLYRAFGGADKSADLGGIMKELLRLKQNAWNETSKHL